MDTPTDNSVPQPTNPAPKIEDSQLLTSKPTCLGQPPPGLELAFLAAPFGQMPEFAPLPAPKERCPISWGSRSWLVEHGEAGDFKLIRVRHKGKMRGKVLMHVPSLLGWLRTEMQNQAAGSKGAQ
jgi:hypothetical protein